MNLSMRVSDMCGLGDIKQNPDKLIQRLKFNKYLLLKLNLKWIRIKVSTPKYLSYWAYILMGGEHIQ